MWGVRETFLGDGEDSAFLAGVDNCDPLSVVPEESDFGAGGVWGAVGMSGAGLAVTTSLPGTSKTWNIP